MAGTHERSEERRLNGGLPDESDRLLVQPPDDQAVGENHGFWFFEDGGTFSFHVHLEANPLLWATRREMVHVLLADGRAMSDWQFGLGSGPDGPGSASTRTRCVAPFKTWELRYQGMPYAVSGAEMAAGACDPQRRTQVPIELDLDIRCEVAPWVQGALSPGGMSRDAAAAIGGFRYEQLFRATGLARIGDERRSVTGTGLRTHRVGPRSMAAFAGHAWLTALMPSGRAFGFQRHVRADGSVSFSEGFVSEDGALEPAEVLEAPAMATAFAGETLRAVLRAAGRTHEIAVETVALHHWTRAAGRPLTFGADLGAPSNFVLNNGCARVTWDGEVGFGLLERSALAGAIGR